VNVSPTREEIELRAYRLHIERRGALMGRMVRDWLQAEREVLEKYGKAGLKAKAKSA